MKAFKGNVHKVTDKRLMVKETGKKERVKKNGLKGTENNRNRIKVEKFFVKRLK